jgi:4-hydroxy-3-polyprenylbenzoate decarboxylase
MVDFLVIRVFDCLGYDLGALQRWQGPVEGVQASPVPASGTPLTNVPFLGGTPP